MEIHGENYFDNSDTGLLLVRLTKQLSKGKTWKEDATHSSHQALEKESTVRAQQVFNVQMRHTALSEEQRMGRGGRSCS